MEEATIRKFIGVRRLAHQGVAGERANATRLMESMRRKYPGIDVLADAFEQAESGHHHSAGTHSQTSDTGDRSYNPGGYGGARPPGAAPGPSMGWDWQSAVWAAAGVAHHVYQQWQSSDFAKSLASTLDYEFRKLSSGRVQWSARMRRTEFERLKSLPDAQKQQVAEEIGNQIAWRIYAEIRED